MRLVFAFIGYEFFGAAALMLLGIMPYKAPWQPWHYVAAFAVGYVLVWGATAVLVRRSGGSDEP